MEFGSWVTVIKKCMSCKKDHSLQMTRAQYDRWQAGEHIQDVAPMLTADERELLISGICGKCFDKMFEGEE